MLEYVWSIIQQNPMDWIIGTAVAVGMFVAYILDYKDDVTKLAYKFVVLAEKELGSGTGEEKFNKVMSEIEERLPFIVSLFINKTTVKAIINSAHKKLEEKLQKGEINLLSYAEEQKINNEAKG